MTGTSREVRHDLPQFDNLAHALYAVIHRDLKDRMLFLDHQSRFFRSFVRRIRGFRLPIHLEPKSAAVHPLALRDRLRDGFLRGGWHGYGLARLSRRRCHLMISLGRCDINHGLMGAPAYSSRRLTSSPGELSCCVRSSLVSKWLRHPRCQKQPFQDSSCRSSVERRTRAAATFSSRCATDDVPGMGTMTGERASSQAIATCTGVAPRRRATRLSAPPPAASPPAARGCQGRKASPPFSHSASTSSDERSEKL